jgi:hypothetical protein
VGMVCFRLRPRDYERHDRRVETGQAPDGLLRSFALPR